MIGHLSFGVSDLDRSTAFYDAIMAALGFKRLWTSPNGVGYGLVPNMDGLALLPRADATPPGPGFTSPSTRRTGTRSTPSTPPPLPPAEPATARRACGPTTAP